MMTLTFAAADLQAAVEAAVRAPSQHNTQPWRFRLRDDALDVLADPGRRLRVADRTGWAVRLACGAALYNARLALAVAGAPAEVRVRPDPADPLLLARLVPAAPRPATPVEQRLWEAVPRRHSNREPFWPDAVPPQARADLVAAARAEGGWLDLLVGADAVSALAEIAHSAHRVLDRDPAYRAELARWTRSRPTDDGVPTGAGGPVAEPQDLLPARAFGDRARGVGRDFEAEPLVAVLGTAGDSPSDQVNAGQVLQRVLLTAADAGLAVSMLSQPIEVPGAREQLRLALGRFGAPQMVLRIGYGQPGWPTPRRDATAVIDRD